MLMGGSPQQKAAMIIKVAGPKEPGYSGNGGMDEYEEGCKMMFEDFVKAVRSEDVSGAYAAFKAFMMAYKLKDEMKEKMNPNYD